MQIPQQIYFKNASPRGSKLIATIEGNDLPNIVQVKGTNDIAKVRRDRHNPRPVGWGPEDDRDEREDDDEYDRDERGCHRPTIGTWESKCKYTTLKQTLLFIKKRHCTRVVQKADYDVQGKLIVVVPVAVIKDSSITSTDGVVELKWTAEQEVEVKEYIAEVKRPQSPTWAIFDIEPAMGVGTVYTSTDIPEVSGSYGYRLKATFTNNAPEKMLLDQTLNVTLSTVKSVSIELFSAVYDETSGDILVSWNVLEESSVSRYIVYRLDPGASEYQPALDVPGGLGRNEHPNFVPEPGDYSYQIRAKFTDDSLSDVLDTKVVSIPIPA